MYKFLYSMNDYRIRIQQIPLKTKQHNTNDYTISLHNQNHRQSQKVIVQATKLHPHQKKPDPIKIELTTARTSCNSNPCLKFAQRKIPGKQFGQISRYVSLHNQLGHRPRLGAFGHLKSDRLLNNSIATIDRRVYNSEMATREHRF